MDSNRNNVAIYRCLFSDYDVVLDESFLVPGVDYYLFSDDPILEVYPYQKILVQSKQVSASISNRSLKLQLPLELQSYDATIYLDGNISVVRNLESLINEFLNTGADIGLFRHPNHSTLDEEVELCIANSKSNEADLKNEVDFYSKNGFTAFNGFSDNSVIFRKRHDENMNSAMSYWFELVKTFSGRDQLSLPFVRFRYSLNEHFFDFSPRSAGNKYFTVFPHNVKLKSSSLYQFFNFVLKFNLKKLQRYYIVFKNRIKVKRDD